MSEYIPPIVPPLASIKFCPHCGKDEGYYRKYQISGGIVSNFHFDGRDMVDTEMWDNMTNQKITGGKGIYCITCDKRIAIITEQELRQDTPNNAGK